MRCRSMQTEREIKMAKETGYQCFHCGHHTVTWNSDFDFEDMGYEGQGIVHLCHCSNCGAEIEYRIPIDEDDGK